MELQSKCDELEKQGILRRPEDINMTVEYLSPSFLVKKSNGGHRLVTAFSDVGKYSKPQPSLMPNVDAIFRQVAQWKYIIVRHEIFPEFSGFPEFLRPQRSFSWKSQIRFNIYGGGVVVDSWVP